MFTVKSRKGFSLIGAIAAFSIAMVFLLAITKMLMSTGRAERGLASNLDLSELTSVVRMILEGKKSCEDSGLKDLIIDPAAPDANAIELKLPGETVPFLKEHEIALGSRMVDRSRITHMTKELDLVGNRALYLATLSIETLVNGNAQTLRNPNRDFYFRILLEVPTKKVLSCFTYLKDLGPVIRRDVLLLTDNEDPGIPGGVYNPAGGWAVRKLNTEVYDTGDNATLNLANSHFTLKGPGTYRCSINAPMNAVHENRARLFNVTTGVSVESGTSMHAHGSTTVSNILVELTPNVDTTYRVEHQAISPSIAWESIQPQYGLGLPINFGRNIYTTVSCERFL